MPTKYVLLSIALLVLAAWLRLHDLGGSTLRLDEAVVANMAGGTFLEMVEEVSHHHSSPIGYPAILWALQKLDVSPFTVRIVPALASLVAIGCLLALPAFGVPRGAAFLAGLMATLSVPLIEHAQDAREYGIDTLGAVLMIAGLLAWVRERRRLLLGTSLFAVPLLQYGLVLFGIAVLAAAALLGRTDQCGEAEAATAEPGLDSTHKRNILMGQVRGTTASKWFASALPLWAPAAAFAASSMASYWLTVSRQASRGWSQPFGGIFDHWDHDFERLFNAERAERSDVPLIVEIMSGKLWNLLQHHLWWPMAGLALVAVAAALALPHRRRQLQCANAVFVLCGLSLAVAVGASLLSLWPLDGIRQSIWLTPVIFLSIGMAACLWGRLGAALAGLAAASAGAYDIERRDPWRPNVTAKVEVVMQALAGQVGKKDAVLPLFSFEPAMRFYARAGLHDYSFASDCHWEYSRCVDAMARLLESGVERFWFVGQGRLGMPEAMEQWRREGRLLSVAPHVHLLADGKPVVESWLEQRQAHFRVRYDPGENALIYSKAPCPSAQMEAVFFLHVYPVDRSVLPARRLAHGFDNLDFHLPERGSLAEGACRARVELPDYAIARILTGQYAGEEQLWSEELAFDQP